MHDDRSSRLAPFLTDADVAERVADRALGLLAPEQVAVDRVLMALHPRTARAERETLAYLETLDLARIFRSHQEHFDRLCRRASTAPRDCA